jgi:hypothetical protein
VVQPQYRLNNMRVGLERANSCHDRQAASRVLISNSIPKKEHNA